MDPRWKVRSAYFGLGLVSLGFTLSAFVWFALTRISVGCPQYGPGPHCGALGSSGGLTGTSAVLFVIALWLMWIGLQFRGRWYVSIGAGVFSILSGYVSWSYCMTLPEALYPVPTPAEVIWFTAGLVLGAIGGAIAVTHGILNLMKWKSSRQSQPSGPTQSNPSP